ncbi:NAD(P)H-quinone oxidoreductase [Candidatus Entotheonella palauensis]|uniref:NAD(P)H-quinone oxidoreductase n=1 Tax=Candidatus Entotheonella palauensis TaxID=93172 RepID=UPI000B7CC851|nr:NAD(P)H-quinone oxidoreductase [Candidatus Entotheonella palauensis]
MASALPEHMQVVEITEAGGPEVLVPATRPVPQPRADQVLVQVTAAGVNGPDIMQRRGLYPPPAGASDLPGLEIAGTVVAVGSDVTEWSVGDQLCALTDGGGYVDYCVVLASHCLPIPKGLSLVEAAGIPESFFAVWSNVFMGVGLTSGETFLVHGGAGGIGTSAIQLAKAFGASVYATDSPAERCAACTQLGADRVIDYNEEDFVEVMRNEAKGANVILDIVGGDYIARNIRAAAPDARIIQLAFNKGSNIEINLMPIMLKRLVYTGSTLRSRPDAFKTEITRQIREQVWPLIEAGTIKPLLSKTFPLAQAADAHRLMESATHIGKIILETA